MSDMNFPKVGRQPAPQIDVKKPQSEVKETAVEKETPQAKGEGIPKSAETAGRSQVPAADSIDLDLAMLVKNPKLPATLDAFFEEAYTNMINSGSENPYEEASALTAAYAKELVS